MSAIIPQPDAVNKHYHEETQALTFERYLEQDLVIYTFHCVSTRIKWHYKGLLKTTFRTGPYSVNRQRARARAAKVTVLVVCVRPLVCLSVRSSTSHFTSHELLHKQYNTFSVGYRSKNV